MYVELSMDEHLYHLQLKKYVAVFLWSIAILTISVYSNCDAKLPSVSCLQVRHSTVPCMKLVIFLLYNNLFIYQVLCTLIYRRRSLYSFLMIKLDNNTIWYITEDQLGKWNCASTRSCAFLSCAHLRIGTGKGLFLIFRDDFNLHFSTPYYHLYELFCLLCINRG